MHGINKEQTPLRDYINIKTPEEEGIIPATSATTASDRVIDSEDDVDEISNSDDNSVDMEDDKDDVKEVKMFIEPEVIIGD